MTRTARPQSGVILIEALIGILIFSIGILALIGMQAAAMKNTTDARYRSEAAFLANQIVGQMWVDRANLLQYNDAVGAYGPRDKWRDDVAVTLPGALVPSITIVTVNDPVTGITNEVTVQLQWQQPGDPAGQPPRKLQMTNYII